MAACKLCRGVSLAPSSPWHPRRPRACRESIGRGCQQDVGIFHDATHAGLAFLDDGVVHHALVEGLGFPAQQAGVKLFGGRDVGGYEFVPAEIAGLGLLFAHDISWLMVTFLQASQNVTETQPDFCNIFGNNPPATPAFPWLQPSPNSGETGPGTERCDDVAPTALEQ